MNLHDSVAAPAPAGSEPETWSTIMSTPRVTVDASHRSIEQFREALAAKVAALVADPVEIVTFTGGPPPRRAVEVLRAAGSAVAIRDDAGSDGR